MSERPITSGLCLNGAPSQYSRWLTSSAGAPARVDGRTLYQLLSFAVPYGALLNFYNLLDQKDGDWTNFFLTDPTIILACIASIDIRALERDFFNKVNERDANSAISAILKLARNYDAWLSAGTLHPNSRSARLFSAELAAYIAHPLGEHLATLKNEAEHAASSGLMKPSAELDFSKWRGPWNFSAARHHPHCPDEDNSPAKRSRTFVEELERIFRAFIDVLVQLRKFARTHLPATLQENDHKPQIALYIAYVRLFRFAQRTINRTSRRFAAFYYRQLLQLTNAGPIPDSVYLTFTFDPASGLASTDIPAGTEFPAGTEPDGSTILYATSKDITVSNAALATVRSVRVVQGPLYEIAASPPIAPGDPPQAPQHPLETVIDLKLMNDEAAGKVPQTGLAPWQPFGATQPGATTIATTTEATIGFIIASPYLTLTGGDRSVNIGFDLTAASWQDLTTALSSISAATDLSNEAIFAEIAGSAFDVYLSNSTGWFQLESFEAALSTATSPPAPNGFTLIFQLNAKAPPVEANSLDPAPDAPKLKASLRHEAVQIAGILVYPYSLLAGLDIELITINTTTVDLTALAVSNTNGPVDITAPWPTFGGTPVTGSFLEFTNEELFVKTPDPGTLAISLTWFGLPANADGFFGYYSNYVLGLDGLPSPTPLFQNNTFVGQIDVVNPGTWNLHEKPIVWSGSPPVPGVFLFRTKDDCANPTPTPDGPLCDISLFNTMDIVPTDPPLYYDPASSAIRLTLTEPSYAFGNTLYATNVLNAVIADLPQVDGGGGGLSRPGCQPLNSVSEALTALLLQFTTAAPPTRDNIRTAILQQQQILIQASQGYLTQTLAPLGQGIAAWIRTTWTTSGSTSPAFQAQTIIGRLQSALQSSPPADLPPSAGTAIQKAITLLRAIIWLQQCIDKCAATAAANYAQCAQSQLIACRQKLQQAFGTCMQSSMQLNYPNVPWMPQSSAISISYSATTSFTPQEGNYFYLLPFEGYSEATSNSLLYEPPPGSLQLGFSGLTVAQSLDLLFQMSAAQGGANTKVTWQILSANNWLNLTPDQIPADTTNGLLNTGVLTLDIPTATASDAASTAASSDYRWLQAVTQTPESFPDAIGVYPYPTIATWTNDGDTSGAHLKEPLPPYTIKQSVQTLAAIKSINQPIESFGGRPAETNAQFEIRAAERLRHKDRAILHWDYERLVLDRFPIIWKVQAVPATDANGAVTPACVLVMVVAGSTGQQVADSTEPLATSETIEEIKQYLVSLASPFTDIHVENPRYVRVKVRAEVMFRESTAETGGGGADRLNSDLISYLSPWFYDAQRATLNGDYATSDAIAQFIESRPYVEALVTLQLVHDPPLASEPWYFLTSATTHDITAAPPDADSCATGVHR